LHVADFAFAALALPPRCFRGNAGIYVIFYL
jgi:hypothetical protein